MRMPLHITEKDMTPSKKLHDFLTSMLEWETTLDKQKKSEDYKNNSEVRSNILHEKKEELLYIFTKFLTSRALKTIAKGRLDILATARPPEYDQKILDETIETSGSTTLICTYNKKSLLPYRRYTLIMKSGESKIDRVEGRICTDEDWRKINSI